MIKTTSALESYILWVLPPSNEPHSPPDLIKVHAGSSFHLSHVVQNDFFCLITFSISKNMKPQLLAQLVLCFIFVVLLTTSINSSCVCLNYKNLSLFNLKNILQEVSWGHLGQYSCFAHLSHPQELTCVRKMY